MTELAKLLSAISHDLGDPTSWEAPVEFRDGLALCALNSAYSLRATSKSGQAVLDRYRTLRPTANTDSGPQLMTCMDEAGGPPAFARNVLLNNSKLPGTSRLRTEGIYEGLEKFASLDMAVTTAADLRDAEKRSAAKRAWRSVKGFGPLAWSYLLMNAGVDDETKPDVMIQRYLARHLEAGKPSPARAQQLLAEAAAELQVQPRQLDRAIWLYESPSSK